MPSYLTDVLSMQIQLKLKKMTNIPHVTAAATDSNCSKNATESKEKEVFKLFDKVFAQYSPNETILSFNGGKDCTVLLHLLSRYYAQREDLQNLPIQVLYIQSDNSFDEIEEFVSECQENFNIKLIQLCGSIKTVLHEICNDRPELQAVFMGSRRTDPYCKNLNDMQMTDEGWPKLMRINPILDWSCRDIWNYIFAHNVPYCSLYNLGYTSLGSKTNTKPNPHLKRVNNDTGEVTYLPAYHLVDDDSLERAGRF